MKFDPLKHHRRSIRLKGFDYTKPGWYFVTICIQNRECLFGKIENGRMIVNNYGKIAETCWLTISDHFQKTKLDEYIIMPNHIHGIIEICNGVVGARHAAPLQQSYSINSRNIETFGKPFPGSLSTIIRSFKSVFTNQINKINKTPGSKFWQRNYYEHIIRNEEELYQIRQYIITNPLKWQDDRFHFVN